MSIAKIDALEVIPQPDMPIVVKATGQEKMVSGVNGKVFTADGLEYKLDEVFVPRDKLPKHRLVLVWERLQKMPTLTKQQQKRFSAIMPEPTLGV